MSWKFQTNVPRDSSSDVNEGSIISPKVQGCVAIPSEDRPGNGSSMAFVKNTIDSHHGSVRTSTTSLGFREKCLTVAVPDLLPLNSCLWEDGNFRAINFGVRILLKYGVNLLKSRKPSGWRTIKTSNKAYVMYLKPLNGHDNVLVALGYTERNVDSFAFPKDCKTPNLKQVCMVTADLMLLRKELSFHFCNRIHLNPEISIVNTSTINEGFHHPKQDDEKGSCPKKTQRSPRPKGHSRSLSTYKTFTKRKPPIPAPRKSTRASNLNSRNAPINCHNTKMNDSRETPVKNVPRPVVKDVNQQQTDRKPPVPIPRRFTRVNPSKARNARVNFYTKEGNASGGPPFGNASRSLVKDKMQQQANGQPPFPSPRRLTRSSTSKTRIARQGQKGNYPGVTPILSAPRPFLKDDTQQKVDSSTFKNSWMMLQQVTKPDIKHPRHNIPNHSQGDPSTESPAAEKVGEQDETSLHFFPFNTASLILDHAQQMTKTVYQPLAEFHRGSLQNTSAENTHQESINTPPGAQANLLVGNEQTENSQAKDVPPGARATQRVATKSAGKSESKYVGLPPGSQATPLVGNKHTRHRQCKGTPSGAQATPLVGIKPTGYSKGKGIPPGQQATPLAGTNQTGKRELKDVPPGVEATPVFSIKTKGKSKGQCTGLPPGSKAAENSQCKLPPRAQDTFLDQTSKPTGISKGTYIPPGAQATPLVGTKPKQITKGKYIPPGAQATPFVKFHTSPLSHPSTKKGNRAFGSKMPSIDTESIYQAYTDVRDDKTETNWALVKYAEDKSIVLHGSGTDYEEMLSDLQEDERAYGYVRLLVGDELSRRTKFALVTWIGPNVGALKKAAVSTDKATVKGVFQQFQIEVQSDDIKELQKSELESLVRKAGGANYGTGSRD